MKTVKTTIQTTLGGLALLSALFLAVQPATCLAQGTAFTYQGRLDAGGGPYTGLAEMQFSLWDAASGGNQLGGTLTVSPVGVTNGLFSVALDFGNQFTGANRWLEIALRTNLLGFTTLSPRQPLTATPYAITAGNLTGTLPASQLSGLLPGPSLGGTYSGAVTFNNAANSFTGSGAGLTGLNASQLTSGTVPDARLGANVARTNQVWLLGGNLGAVPGTHFLGTTDNQPLEVRVNNQRVLRLEPNTNNAPNLIGGYAGNYVSNTVVGATIAGGGAGDWSGTAYTNRVLGDFGTVSGGLGNTASGYAATVGGGRGNLASTNLATVGGGLQNIASGLDSTVSGGWANLASGSAATVSGGDVNTASGEFATVGGGTENIASGGGATVGGGLQNIASGQSATVGGGWYNEALGGSATISGGEFNTASGGGATIPGGFRNVATAFAFAAGRRAKANHTGAFVWADSQDADFASTAENQFSLRASGGVRLNNDTSLSFGNQTRQMINLWNTEYGIGVQSATTYFRSGNDFAWFKGGSHSDTTGNAGAGGSALMFLSRFGNLGLGTTSPGAQVEAVAAQSAILLTSTGSVNGAVLTLRNNTASPTYLGAINFETTSGTPGQLGYLASDEMAFRVGGVQRMLLNASGLTVNGTFVSSSDRNAKENFQPVNPQEVLEKVATLPVSQWNYKDDAGARHIGPMAQDFHAAFGVGPDDKHIATVDADGVALAAIQGLNQKLQSETSDLRRENAVLRAELAELKQLVRTLATARNGGDQ